jgi:hypothetical protein
VAAFGGIGALGRAGQEHESGLREEGIGDEEERDGEGGEEKVRED